MYFCIRTTEDGIQVVKIDNINKFLQDSLGETFLEDFPEDRWNKKRICIDKDNYPDEDEIILIKGEIIVPKKVEVVTQYKLED